MTRGHRQGSRIFGVFLAAVLMMPARLEAGATTIVMLSDEDLIVSSRAIVRGTVVAVDSQFFEPHKVIYTYITIKVEEVLKGPAFENQIVIRQLGGRADNLEQTIFGSPSFSVGEEVLLYLNAADDGALRVAHILIGKFTITRDQASGKRMAKRLISDVKVLKGPYDDEITNEMELGKYEEKIRAVLGRSAGRVAEFEHASENRPLHAVPPEYSPGLKSSGAGPRFTLLGSGYRWFEADTGTPVSFFLNPTGAPVSGGGSLELSGALSAWTSVANASIILQPGGSTGVCGFSFDRVSSVSFDDCLHQIDDPVGCSGALAIGGVSAASNETKVVNGQVFNRIVEGDVVFNNNFQCFLSNSVNLAEVMTHEIGHAIGAGHSSENPNESVFALRDATMYFRVHADGRGASVHSDDMAFAQFAYPRGSAGQPGTLQFSSATYSVNENGGSATLTMTRSGGSSGVVTVTFATSDGTATAGSDYTSVNQTITFSDGDTSDKTVTVPILDDAIVEGNETVNLTLSNPTGGATLGSQATAVLTIIDTDQPPVVTLSVPAANALLNNRMISVSGTVSAGTSVVPQGGVAINGTTASFNAATGAFSETAAAALDGPFVITVIATDVAGNTSAPISRTVTIDTAPPSVVISSPVNGAILNRRTITVTGTATDVTSGIASVSVNGTAVVLSGTGSAYQATVIAGADGPFTVTVTATDVAGNSASVSHGVTIDTAGPAIAITAPTAAALLTSRTVSVTGTATDATTAVASVTVNGTAVTVRGGTFTTTVTAAADGAFTMTVVGTDTAGNQTTVTRAVTIDTVGPVVAITSPASGAFLNSRTVSVTGRVSDATSMVASVTVNGVAATVTGGNYSATATASADGSFTITVVATDAAGNSTTVTRTVIITTTLPAVTITSPAANANLNSRTVIVTGTATSATSTIASVTVNGVAATVTGSNYTATVTASADGAFAITVMGTDAAGNASAPLVRAVNIDTVAPSVVISSPAASAILNSRSVAVSVSALDTAGSGVASVSISSTAATFSATTGLWTAAVTATADGAFTISATATDIAGNTSAAVTRNVTIDTVAPVVAITSPASGAILTSRTIAVSTTVSDTGGSGVASVSINGVAATAAGGGVWNATVTATADGSFTISATATDNAGNTSAPVTRSVTIDTVAPVVAITSPAAGATLTSTSITVTGTVTDTGGTGVANVKVNGVTATLTAGTWTATITAPGAGAFTISVTATDNAGNTSAAVTRSVTVVLVSVTGASFVPGTLTITGTGFAAGAVVKIDGVATTRPVTVASATTITVSGSKRKIGVKGGTHTVQVTVGTASSNVFSFTGF